MPSTNDSADIRSSPRLRFNPAWLSQRVHLYDRDASRSSKPKPSPFRECWTNRSCLPVYLLCPKTVQRQRCGRGNSELNLCTHNRSVDPACSRNGSQLKLGGTAETIVKLRVPADLASGCQQLRGLLAAKTCKAPRVASVRRACEGYPLAPPTRYGRSPWATRAEISSTTGSKSAAVSIR